jgi:hypothetical protein
MMNQIPPAPRFARKAKVKSKKAKIVFYFRLLTFAFARRGAEGI